MAHHQEWKQQDGQQRKDRALAVLSESIKGQILKEHYNYPTAGHPGTTTTYFSIRNRYWWPRLKEWVQQYVKDYGVCQQNKSNMRSQKPLLFPITSKKGAHPFEVITMDWITKLPPSFGHNSTLTITDYDCSKAVLLFPCKKTITTQGLAKLYFNKVFSHYRIPQKIISDQDTRLTSMWAHKICKKSENQLEYQHHLPSTNRRTIRKN